MEKIDEALVDKIPELFCFPSLSSPLFWKGYMVIQKLPNRFEHQFYQFLTFHSDIFKNGTRDLTRTNDSMRSEGWPRGSVRSPCARQLPSTSQTAETFVQDCFRDSNGKI